LDNIRHLPGTNGNHLVNQVIEAYLKDTPLRLSQPQTANQTGDLPALRQAAHTLKSASANVGAKRLSKLCKEIEDSARQGSFDGIFDHLTNVMDEFPRAQATLVALQQGTSVQLTTPGETRRPS